MIRKFLYFFSAVSLGLAIFAMPVAVKAAPKAAKKAVVIKKAPVKAVVKKKAVKKKVGVAAKVAPSPANLTSSVKLAGALAPVSSEAETNFTAACNAAIQKANAFCLKVSRGCSSFSTSEKCVAANADCEERQNAAMESCPAR